jgi:hypothetical protein
MDNVEVTSIDLNIEKQPREESQPVVVTTTQEHEVTSRKDEQNLQLKFPEVDSDMESVKSDIKNINPDLVSRICAKTSNVVFFETEGKFTHITGLNCFGGIFIRQTRTIIMASSILQMNGRSDNFYCVFICTSSNHQICIVGTYDFENISRLKMSDFSKTVGPFSETDELKIIEMQKKKLKQPTTTQKKDTRKRKLIEYQKNECDSDTENTSSQEYTNSPPSPKAKEPKQAKINQSKVSQPKVTRSSSKNSNKSTKSLSSKSSIKQPTTKLPNTRLRTQNIPVIEQDIASTDTPKNDINYEKIVNSLKSIIKKELYDMSENFKQTIPTSTPVQGSTQVQTPTQVHSTQIPIPAQAPAQAQAQAQAQAFPNIYAGPFYSVPSTYSVPNTFPTPPNTFTAPPNTYATPPAYGYPPGYYQAPTYPPVTPYLQVPNQFQVLVPPGTNMLGDEIAHHLEKARHHSDMANRLLSKTTK